MYNNWDCLPTYLVTSVTNNGGVNYILNFKTVPTLQDRECIKFRLADCITLAATPALPIFANVNINGVLTSVPLRNAIGNNVRTGENLKIRRNYKGVFGTDTPHLQVFNLGENCKCSEV